MSGFERQGGCHCGAVRYVVVGEPTGGTSLCHCLDCRRHAGAPAVAWATFLKARVRVIAGKPVEYASSVHGRRRFCGACGTGLFFISLSAPGEVDVQTATFDDPSAFPPAAQEQVGERIMWMADAQELPAYERFPPDRQPPTS